MARKAPVDSQLPWLDAGKGYTVALAGGKILCRNAKGALLASLPAALKESERVEELRALADWLGEHDKSATARVESFLLRSLPVPRALIEAVWLDPDWRRLLENLVVAPLDAHGNFQLGEAGFLRAAEPGRLGMVGTDGETRWLDAELVVLPHPILLPELQDLRELATELGLQQALPQLFRETWAPLGGLKPEAPASSSEFAEGRFAQLLHAVGRSRSLGYRVQGGWASCRVFEAGRLVEARFWLGSESPDYETLTGELYWVDESEKALKWADLGPVAFSEGHRMASLIYAGRAIPADAADAAGSASAEDSLREPAPERSRSASLSPPRPLTAREVLTAGGLLAAGSEAPADLPSDLVEARTYKHPALGDRPVLRLVPQLLLPGEERAMDFLGFSPSEPGPVLARQQRQALGFPGWALLHDPEHAGFALEVVKEFKKFSVRASVKALYAKEGFDAIGEKLGRSVPHFLPSFYEEVGRAFIAAGNLVYAAQAFGKAREAERVHALEVDEDRRLEVFVDFALAGALTAKALAAYAQDLAKTYPPVDAYRHFRELCLRRTLGGLPPFAAMAKELRALSKAAGLDASAEEIALLRILLATPGIARAPGEFWNSVRASLIAAARADAALRGVLLNLFPGAGLTREFHGKWLDLLRECGALAGVVGAASSVPPEAEPTGGPAAFLSRFLAHATGSKYRLSWPPPQYFVLLEEAAPRLRSDGQPLRLAKGVRLGVDLLEFALGLELPVAPPALDTRLDFDLWLQDAPMDPGLRRLHRQDPVRVAADRRFAPLLQAAVFVLLESSSLPPAVSEKEGFLPARRAFFEEQLQALEEGTLHSARDALERLQRAFAPTALNLFAELCTRLAEIDMAALLARTLRAGLLDELGWPALEAAVEELGPETKFFGAFPYLLVANTHQTIVLGPRGRIREYLLRIPAGHELESLRYVEGQVLVVFRQSWPYQAYWTGAPSEIFEWSSFEDSLSLFPSIELPGGGGISFGGRALHAGDRKVDYQFRVYGDGEHLWRLERGGTSLCEVNPQTGELGRASLPSFFEASAAPGYRFRPWASSLYPLPPGLEETLLGCRQSLSGWRVCVRENTSGPEAYECEGIDGRRWQGSLAVDRMLLGLCRFPGDAQPRPLARLGSKGVGLLDATGRFELASGALGKSPAPEVVDIPGCLPESFWHYLRPREELASSALRVAGREQALALLAAAREDLAAGAAGQPASLLRLREVLPALTDSRLCRAVASLARFAAETADSLEQLLISSAGTASEEDPEIAEEALQTALGRLLTPVHFFRLDGQIAQQARESVRFFAAVAAGENANRRVEVAPAGLRWESLLGKPGLLAFLAINRATPWPQRQACAFFLRLLARLPIAFGRWRLLGGASVNRRVVEATAQWLAVEGGNAYLVKQLGFPESHWFVLEFALDGPFRPLAGFDHEETKILDPAAWAQVDVFLAELGDLREEWEPRPWDRAIAVEIARRTGISEAAAALLWLVYPGSPGATNFLAKELRSELGLKVGEAAAARDELRTIFGKDWAFMLPDWFGELHQAAFDAGPGALWRPLGAGQGDEQSAVAAFSRAFSKRVGHRFPIPAEVVQLARRELVNIEPAGALQALASLATSSFGRDAEWQLSADGKLENPSGSGFSRKSLQVAAQLVPFLYGCLPVGDPLRDQLPELLELTRARLQSRDLILPLASSQGEGDFATAFLQGLGAAPYAALAEPGSVLASGDTGALIVMVLPMRRAGWQSLAMFFRPALADDLEVLSKLAYPQGSYGVREKGPEEVALLRFEGYRAMAERVAATPVPAGQWEQNPLHAVPELVAQVAAHHGLEEDAAVLYLQTLALAEPTSKAVQQWNGWSPKRYLAAAAALTAAGLLLEAKRERAGRGHFLPGGWTPFKAPNLPTETFKLPLYGVGDAAGGHERPLTRIVPLRPFHQLFAAAWDLVLAGNGPAYEEV